nr:MAG: hypothetical protein 1 [Guangxi cystovirus 6]
MILMFLLVQENDINTLNFKGATMKDSIVIHISKRYYEIIGKPDLKDDLVKRAIYLRLDACSIRGVSEGFEARPTSILALSEELGYNDQDVIVEILNDEDSKR